MPLRELSRGPDPLMTSEDLTKIFSNCEMIALIHKQLLESLEGRMAKWSKTQLIGDIFVTWVSTANHQHPFNIEADFNITYLGPLPQIVYTIR